MNSARLLGSTPPLGSQAARQVSTRPVGNPFTPPIPHPISGDPQNTAACIAALKASVESLIGQRGDAANRAVTFRDLLNYGVLDPAALESPHGSVPPYGGGGGVDGSLYLPLTGGTLSGPGDLDVHGTTTVVTPATADNSTKAATTAWVRLQSYATTAQLGNYLLLAGGTITGSLTVSGATTLGVGNATTPASADNSTRIATTAYVKSQNFLTGNQTISISGDASGSGTTAIPITLATVNSNVGTWNNVTVNAKGLVTAGSNVTYLTGNQTITHTGDVTGSGTTSIPNTVVGLQGRALVATAPTANQVLAWSGSAWTPTTPAPAAVVPTSPPPSPVVGQLYWNPTDQYLYIWYGGAWVPVGGLL